MAYFASPNAPCSYGTIVPPATLSSEERPQYGLLALRDGTVFAGYSFGADVSVSGECVFQTGLVGYPESLTDPSYRGQILIPTYPLIGNYGVPNPDARVTFKNGSGAKEASLSQFFESDRIQASGLIVAKYSHSYSHYAAVMSLSDWLKRDRVPALYGLDTRALTKKIREHGVLLGKILLLRPGQSLHEVDLAALGEIVEWADPNTRNIVAEVSTREETVFTPAHFDPSIHPTILAVDVGMKANQIRCFLKRNARVRVVPWDFDFNAHASGVDGIFISNGPGDPKECKATIAHLKQALAHATIPIFGICLGHQLMALAAGAETRKMCFGNRGHNIPCKDLKTGRCYITSQNHGFAVQAETLPLDWEEYFRNVNDKSNEGIVHKTKPFFSVQFHPEAAPGPQDTEFLFDIFLDSVNRTRATGTLAPLSIAHRAFHYEPSAENVRKVLILGSGGLSIGQAGEFDYSGSQAIKALKEEGIYTILINPNIATIQTSKGLADKVYFLPLRCEWVRKVIEYEKPDGIYVTFGGQTALNVGVQMRNEFAALGVRVLGTPIEAIIATEDREIFSQRLAEINEKCADSDSAVTLEEALAAADRIGYPVICRAAYALGGLGSGFAENKEQLAELCKKAFSVSPQILVEKSMKGWKEIEYEVVRDAYDNCITVCNMENFDPLGIHTGDSIVVAPSQTLSDENFQTLRSTAIKVIRHLGVVGECNIQYALNPSSNEYCIIEVNARLSRSSALASKATGYPLAFVAAKLGLGIRLDEIQNQVTRCTFACFEPSLDYCVVKIPRWDLKKFSHVSKKISSAMKSVGEVMSIGRTFEEAIQKGIRALDLGVHGFSKNNSIQRVTDESLSDACDERIFYLANAFYQGYTVDRIWQLTKIDKWFLECLASIYRMSVALESMPLASLKAAELVRAKQLGFSDMQVAAALNSSELSIRQLRKELRIFPHAKQIDTVAAEFPCTTNYLYHTYAGIEHDVRFEDRGVIVLGSGVYRIGSSVEFDWCAVRCVRTLRSTGHKTIMINYNPETVSTDFDEVDRLYFENMTLETVLDVYDMELAAGVIVSMGGQIPNNIALSLHRLNVRILGTSPESIDQAENRYKFSRLLDKIDVDQPLWKELTSLEDALAFCEQVGYPVLVRPSYVLSGAAMNVVFSGADLSSYLAQAAAVSRDYPVVISKYIEEAKEIEMDAVALNGKVIVQVISEHVENAGVHSGDATLVLPPQDLDPETMRKVESATLKIADALTVTGPFNIQFIAKNNEIKVIECNVRASRSFPFVSKTLDLDLVEIATWAMTGHVIPSSIPLNPVSLKKDTVAVKVPQFSFGRLSGADPILGVEMASTGEVACFGRTKYEAYIKALMATGFALPKKNILLSIGSFKEKQEFLPSAFKLRQLGFVLYATSGTADFFSEHRLSMQYLEVLDDKSMQKMEYSLEQALSSKHIDLYINLPSKNKYRRPASYMSRGYRSRRMAVDMSVPLITNIKCAKLFVEALARGFCSAGAMALVAEVDSKSSSTVLVLPGMMDLVPRAGDFSQLVARWGATIVNVLRSPLSTAAAARAPILADYVVSSFPNQLFEENAPPVPVDSLCYINEAWISSNAADTDANSLLCRLFHRLSSHLVPGPLLVDCGSSFLASILLFATFYNYPVHLLAVRSKEDLSVALLAKEKGSLLTVGISLHDFACGTDRDYFRAHLDQVDCFTLGTADLQPKLGRDEHPLSLLPMLLSAMESRLSVAQFKARVWDNPRRIMRLAPVALTDHSFVEIECDHAAASVGAASRPSRGLVRRVCVRGVTVVLDGVITTGEYAGLGVALKPGPPEEPLVVQSSPPSALPLPPSTLAMLHETAVTTSSAMPVASAGPAALVAVPPPASVVVDPTVAALRSDLVSLQLKPSAVFFRTSVTSVKDWTRTELHYLYNVAQEMRQLSLRRGSLPPLLQGRVLCTLFYEPSTRTSCSFESAMLKLGGSTIKVQDNQTSSIAKGEGLQDTVRTLSQYADVIVLRHHQMGSAAAAAAVSSVPVINAGDGAGEHPTQALMDVFTIREELGTVNGLTITVVGDLKYGRTVHSLVRLLSLYHVRLVYVPLPGLELPEEIRSELAASGQVEQQTLGSLQEAMPLTDVLYVTRVQKERLQASDRVSLESYRVDPKLLQGAKSGMIIMHPLPRNDEIDPEVDFDQRAAYFRQMKYGLHVRMALLYLILTPPEVSFQ